MDITIRDAETRDVDVLAELSRVVLDMHVAALPAYFKDLEPGGLVESFRSKLERPDCRAFIASLGEVPVGYTVVALRERPESGIAVARRALELEELAVSPSHRRLGVARALVERVLTEARAQGLEVELTSWAFNTDAHAAFRALGFAPMIVRFRYAGR